MPHIALGSSKIGSSTNLTGIHYDYKYPEGLDLRPQSKLHKKIKDEILRRARDSANTMSTRHPSWNRLDETLTGYIDLTESEDRIKDKDSRKPVSVVFPYSYTILETLMSYLMNALLQPPYFRYEGYSPEDVIGAILMEKVVNLHCNKFKVGLNLHTQFRDSLVYGFGAVSPQWDIITGNKVTKRTGILGNLFGDKVEEDKILFEGNALSNIDPYLYLPDVNVSIDTPQKGEYVGWVTPTNYHDLLSEEASDQEDMFNVKYLKHVKGARTSIFPSDKSKRNRKSGVNTRDSLDRQATTPVDVIRMYIKLIPRDWNLSDKETPEKWYFALSADQVVISARPAAFDHDKFSVGVCAPEYDGHSATPLSRLEIIDGLQETVNWLFNSHIQNVRKAINDMLIVDPYLVNIDDVKDPRPGKIIRMRRPAWGKGVKDAVQQLAVNDITRANVGDVNFLVDLMQKTGATDSAIQGSLRKGGPERLTSTEFQGTQQGAASRIEHIARIISMQSMQDIGEIFAKNTQQLMTEETYIKVVGDWQKTLIDEYGTGANGKIDRGRLKVTPDDLLVDYDVIIKDGSVPGGNFSPSWITLFKDIASNEQLIGEFDMVRIFKHIARNMGAKNVNEFVKRGGDIQASAQSQGSIDEGVRKGNLAPVEEAL